MEESGEGMNEQGGPWTNEKHLRYLNSMEASFVRTMLDNNNAARFLRLDRCLSDCSESTLDLKSSQFLKRRKQVNPDVNMGPASSPVMDGRADRRRTRKSSSSSQRHDPSSQDQVDTYISGSIDRNSDLKFGWRR